MMRSFRQQKLVFLTLHATFPSCRHGKPREVHPRGSILCIPDHAVVASLLKALNEMSNFTPEDVVDDELDMGISWQSKPDCRGRVEGIGETLLECEILRLLGILLLRVALAEQKQTSSPSPKESRSAA